MNKLLRTALLVCLVSAPFLSLFAQEEADNTFTLNMNMLSRGELCYGGFREEDQSLEGMSHFILGRYRLTADYKRSWLETKITLQHSGVWGMNGGSFGLNEAWVGVKSKNGWFARFGRQTLAYDDERIMGTNDWSVTAPSHDVLRMGYEGKQQKLHLLLAYNQNPENMFGQTYFTGGLQPYKSMQALWYHYDVPQTKLGMSLLFMNFGMQNDDNLQPEVFFQQTLGTYIAFKPQRLSLEGTFYYQMGREEHGIPLQAFLASAKTEVKPRDNYSVYGGYDYLSGDRYFAVPPEGQIGVVFHDKVRGFNTIYGSHHKFYGMMDFFYLSTYVNNFTPGLQNAFLGATYKPVKDLTLNASVHYLAMATKLPELDKTLGGELELVANYQITKYFVVEAGYSYMHGTETLQTLKRVSDGQRLHWGYLMLVVSPDVFTASWNDKK